jgi:hypothetical protein
MRSRPSDNESRHCARALDVERSRISALLPRSPTLVVNKRLDLINGLLYTLPQSPLVDVLQIPYRNWLGVPRMRRLVNLFLF